MKKFLIFFLLLIFFGYFIALTIIKNSFNTVEIKNSINNIAIEKIAEYNKHYSFQKKEIKFSIRNSINLTVFPNIKLIVNDFDIKNTQYKDVILNMNIKKIEITLNFFDFFKKKLTPKQINVSGISFVAENNKLEDFYLKKEIKKRVVKLDDNEVFGVRDKLKNLLTLSNDSKSAIQEGYKEVEIEEDTRYDLDNSKVKFMILDLLKILKVDNFNIVENSVPEIKFNNFIFTIVEDGNIQKEFKNISGSLKIKNMYEYDMNFNFILNNVNGSFNLSTKEEDNNKYSIDFNIKNELNDNINIKHSGNNIFIDDFEKVNMDINLNIKTDNFNNLVQWVVPVSSKYYNIISYKKSFSFESNINKTGFNYKYNNLKIDGNDIKLSGNMEFLQDKNNINIEVEDLNLDEFILNFTKEKNKIKNDDITIFKINEFDELISLLKQKELKSIKNTNISIKLDKLLKQDQLISDSVIDFDIIDNNYKINKLIINFGDIKITADNPELKDDLYYNKLNIVGANLSNLIKILNLDSVVNIKDFNLNSNLLIYDNIIYLIDYKLNGKNEDKEYNISGDVEYSFKKNYEYLATSIVMDSLNLTTVSKDSKTLKEKFLWLNNLSNINNIFLSLNVDNVKYNNYEDFSLKTKMNYYSGYLNIYDIEEINSNIVKNLRGNILIDVRNKNPIMNINLSIEDFSYDVDLVNYVFDIEKYKSLITREEPNDEIQNKYWINKLFSIPTWEEINGKINVQIQNTNINNTKLNNVNIDANVRNGLINLNNLIFIGLGGSTELKGKIDLKTTKNINLILTDTVYNIRDIFNLFSREKKDDLIGTIGVGGIIQASGFNNKVFASSMVAKFKFISKDLYVKKLGLEELKNNLKNIYSDEILLKNLNVKESILNDSGTTFNDVSANLTISSGINNFNIDAKADSISNKLISKIDNSGQNININIINTSIIMNKIGNNSIPLYSVITFKEDFANKANLTINTSQIEEYVNKIKKTKGIN